jgi:WD40 repeat protein
MDPERLDSEETADLLDECVALPLAERTAFLDRRCAGRERLRREVESLLSFLPDPEPDDDDESARAMRRVGLEIGGCRLLELIAIGGMGAVYRAEQESPRREVAVKVLRPDGLGTDAWRRLKREALALGRLDHPAIARVFTAGIHRDGHGATPYLTMELVEGARTVTEWWRSTRLPRTARLERFATICEAIHHGHMKGVPHRDVKPSNLLVDRDDRPKVIDFGIARVLEPGTDSGTAPVTAGRVIGTISYLSPERLEGRGGVDVRSDVYGLGIVLYELLAGTLPFGKGDSLAATAASIARGAAPRPSTFDRTCRGDLDAIVATAMAPNPDDRYDSVSALAADLRAHLADRPIRARGAGRLAALKAFLRRNRLGVAAAASVFLALLTGLVFSLRATARAERALFLSKLAQGDFMMSRGEVGGVLQILREIGPERQDQWAVEVLERSTDDSIDSVGFGEWNLFRGRSTVDRSRVLASGWGERPELVVLRTSPAGVERRIPLPSLGMGADWGIPLADGEATVIAGLADGRVVGLRERDGSIVRVFTRVEIPAEATGPDTISDVALHPGGRWLAVGHSTDTVRLVDLLDGTERDIHGFANPAEPNWIFLDWSPDGSRLAVAATGGTFTIEAETGRVNRLSRKSANQSVFSPDGTRVASVGSDGGHEIIELETGEVSGSPQPRWPTWGAAWSPDGRSLAIVGRSNIALVEDPEQPLMIRFSSPANPIWTVCWISPDSILTLPRGHVHSTRQPPLWLSSANIGTRPGIQQLERTVVKLRFISGGAEIVATGPGGIVERIDPLLGIRRKIAEVPVRAAATDLCAISGTCAIVSGLEPGPLWLVDAEDGSIRKIDGEFLGPVAIAPGGRRAAVLLADGDASIVDCETGRIEGRSSRSMKSRTIDFVWLDAETVAWCLPVGGSILTRHPDGSWSSSFDQRRAAMAIWPGRDGNWYWSDLSSRLCRSGPMAIGDPDAPELFRDRGRILCLAPHPTLPLVACGTADGRVLVFDESLSAVVANYAVAVGNRTTGIDWSLDGSMLTTLGVDGTIRFFDRRSLADRWPEIEQRWAEVASKGGNAGGG